MWLSEQCCRYKTSVAVPTMDEALPSAEANDGLLCICIRNIATLKQEKHPVFGSFVVFLYAMVYGRNNCSSHRMWDSTSACMQSK